jgi:single-stranded-DNA-specific exonuclease
MKEVPDSIINEFGGHSQAGGFSLTEDGVHMLEQILIEKLETITVFEEKQNAHIDTTLTFDDVTERTYSDIEKLAPYGLENPKPVFLFENVVIDGINHFGKEKNHLELSFRNSQGRPVKAIAFFKTSESYDKPLLVGETISLHMALEKSYFKGRPELRLRILNIM